MRKKILFLGYSSKKTKIIKHLKKKNFVYFHGQKNLSKKLVSIYDIVISFGYKKIIKKNILQSLSRPPINLHISYLPYNKGAHPNFWSFIENTPKGVSIHEIDEKIDNGKIIFRKKIAFKDNKKLTFKKAYLILFTELEKLFIKNSYTIINKRYRSFRPKIYGTFHNKKDLPKNFSSWNIEIKKYLTKYYNS